MSNELILDDDYDAADDAEAGYILDELFGDDGEGDDGDHILVEDEAGFLEFIIPAAIAAEAKKRGITMKTHGKDKRGGRRRTTRIPSRKSGGRRGKGRRGGRLHRALRSISGNSRRIARIEGMLRNLQGAVGVAEGRELTPQQSDMQNPRKGARMWIGTTTPIAAPGAAGAAAFGLNTIRPSNAVRVVSIVGYVYEDTFAAAAANQVAIAPETPFFVTLFNFGSTQILVSETPAIPGQVLSVQGQQYGFPIGTARALGLAASAPIQINGSWSPRAQGGTNPGDAVFAALCPSLAA